jgi:hypothetical protein
MKKTTATTTAPTTTIMSNCSWGGNGEWLCRDDGKRAQRRWQHTTSKKNSPRDVVDVSWAAGKFFFSFSFHFLVTNKLFLSSSMY